MTYRRAFYTRRTLSKEYAAKQMLEYLLTFVDPIERAVDVGCGIGTWLAELHSRGCEVRGYDGKWVDLASLKIPTESFTCIDLQAVPALEGRYDLAISLEVAEHLPAAAAATFVNRLTQLSELVLFSAAIPGQGGTHHVNEQWPSYWQGLFSLHGYVPIDLLRPKFWHDAQVPVWYRQNALIYASEGYLQRCPKLAAARAGSGGQLLDVVHPELYRDKSLLPVRQAFTRMRWHS